MATVLVVDDEAGTLSLFERVLGAAGHAVLCSSSGEACLPILRDANPDVVILDEKLPGMNGIRVLRRIRDLDREVPVIMMSGYGTVKSIVRAMELGAYDYLTKPFRLEEALKVVSEALEMKRMLGPDKDIPKEGER